MAEVTNRLAIVGVLAMTCFAGVATAFLISTPTSTASARAVLPTGNLVYNPGAEFGPASDDTRDVTPEPDPLGWWHGDFSWTQVKYGAAGGFPDEAVAEKIGGGSQFFAAGPSAKAVAQRYQEIQIDPEVLSEITTGNAQVKLSAWIGGYSTDTDSAVVRLAFHSGLDHYSASLGVRNLGPVSPEDRDNKTNLVLKSLTADVPPGTRSFAVWLLANHTTGAYIDAYFDNISLIVVAKNSSSPPPTTTTSPPPTETTTTTPPKTETTTTTTAAPSKPPAKNPKPMLSLACAGKTLIATVKPAKGPAVSSVWFYVNGTVRSKDRRAPFMAAVPTKGLHLPLEVAAAIQTSGKSTFLRKQYRGC